MDELRAALSSRVRFSLCQLMSVFLVRQQSKGAQITANTCNKTFLPPLTSSPILYATSVVKVCVCVHVRALREDPGTLLNRESF